jgi:hypothetical protein
LRASSKLLPGGLTMKAIFWALAIVTTLTANPAAAQDYSANHYLSACSDMANAPVGNPFTMGECMGIVEALSQVLPYLDRKFNRACVPDGVTNFQMMAVVVRWLDQHPQRWNENFIGLALLALHEAWPCR